MSLDLPTAKLLEKLGPQVAQIHGVELPLHYRDVKAEVAAVRDSAGLFDASYYRVLRVLGPDAPKFLQNLTTNDVLKLPVGQLQNSALLDRKGKVLALFSIIRADETGFLILVQPDLKEFLNDHLNQMRFIQEVEINDESDKWGWLWIAGPQALAVAGDVLNVHPDMLPEANKIMIPADRSAWHLWRNERWAVPAVFLFLPRGEVAEAFDLVQAGGALVVGKEAIDIVRLEAGIPEYGLEIDSEHILLEANLADSFARNKGCYPGQEVVERISAYGEGKTPYILKIWNVPSKHLLEIGSPIVNEKGEEIARVVRCLYDPATDRSFIAAYIPNRYFEAGAAVQIKKDQIQLGAV